MPRAVQQSLQQNPDQHWLDQVFALSQPGSAILVGVGRVEDYGVFRGVLWSGTHHQTQVIKRIYCIRFDWNISRIRLCVPTNGNCIGEANQTIKVPEIARDWGWTHAKAPNASQARWQGQRRGDHRRSKEPRILRSLLVLEVIKRSQSNRFYVELIERRLFVKSKLLC